MDLLFNIFISPVLWLMQNLFINIFNVVNNYGFSLIILSIFINILILPLSYLAESLKDRHKKKISSFQFEVDLIKKNYSGQEKHYYLQALYKINKYHPFSSLAASSGLLLQIPFFIAAYYFIGNYEEFKGVRFGPIIDLGQPDSLLFGQNLLPILMTVISFISAHIYTKNMTHKDKYPIWILSIVFLLFLYLESSALLLYWTINNFFTLMKNWLEQKFSLDRHKIYFVNLLVLPFKIIIQIKVIKFIYKDIYVQSVILFFGTIFIYQAIPIAASDPSMYSVEYIDVVLYLAIFFISSIFISLVIYNFLSNKICNFLKTLVSFSALSGLFFAFLFPFKDLGLIVSLSIPEFLIFESMVIKIFKLFFIFTLFICWILIFKKIISLVLPVILISNIFLISQTVIAGINPKEIKPTPLNLLYKPAHADNDIQNQLNPELLNNTQSKTPIPKEMTTEEAINLYSFSRDSNTIVILLDAFQGNMFADIIKNNPDIIEKFTGFTYYPNTLSAGGGTWESIGAILGGEEYQMHRARNLEIYEQLDINHQGKEYLAIQDAYLKQANLANKYNHNYAVSGSIYGDCSIFDDYENVLCSTQVISDNEYLEKNKNFLEKNRNSSFNTAKFFSQLSWTLSLPHVTKSKVSFYFRNSGIFTEFIKENYYYSQLKNLIDFSNNKSQQKTLKFFYNSFTHSDFLIDDNCEIVYEFFTGYIGAYNADYCATRLLVSFFDKLKKLDIYDETKIIIMSDHGHHKLNENIQHKNYQTIRPISSALLLVKDFDNSGSLKTSMQFMSNMDIYGIALSGVSEGKETHLDKTKTTLDSRILINIHRVSPHITFNISQAYRVKDNIFDNNNWEKLDSLQIEELYK